LLRQKTSEELRNKINNILQQSPNCKAQIVAAKQLKSEDISICTANTEDASLLKEYSEIWVKALGSRARVLKPTYGVLVHGVRTDKENIDPSKQAEAIEKIKTENASLHPGMGLTYVGWLTKNGAKKTATSLAVELATKEQANRAIREGLVVGACQHDCELYERSCKLKQCYKCQRYGHIGTQCNAEETCGNCAGPYNSRLSRKKEEDPNVTPKCVLWNGPHTAWSNACQIRQTQLAKVEHARRTRPAYFYGTKAIDRSPQAATTSATGGPAPGGSQRTSPPTSTIVPPS